MSTTRQRLATLAAGAAVAGSIGILAPAPASADTLAQNPGDSCALSSCDTNWRAVWEGVKLVTPF